MMLDATGGTRQMWPNKNPPYVVFMDKNIESFRPPHIFGVWESLPFRDDSFETVLFDPPHKLGRTTGAGKWATPAHKEYWGIDLPKMKFRTGVYHGTREFLRVAKRLCFKWNNIELDLDRVLSLFPRSWRLIHIREIHKNIKTKTVTYWVTFIKESENE